MGILNLAKDSSIFKGYEYYKGKKVISYKKITETTYEGEIIGSENNIYTVYLDLDKPRKSTCNCPFAKDNTKICKHKIALFFTVNPKEAQLYVHDMQKHYHEAIKIIAKKEEQENKRYKEIKERVNSMSEKEVRNMLINYMLEEYGDDDYDEDYGDIYEAEYFYNYFADEETYYEKIGNLKLSTVVEAFKRITNFNTIYINIHNNEIIEILDDYDTELYLELTDKILNDTDNYILLPMQHELNNFETIREFIDTVNNIEHQTILYKMIQGKNPFRKFKDAVYNLGLKENWFKFEYYSLIEKAKDFLFNNYIYYIDDINE